MKNAENQNTSKIIYTLLTLITVAIYLPLYKNGFIGFDDHTYIYQNNFVKNGLTWEGVKFAFSLHNETSYWHPLTWLSLMLDAQLWGLNPVGYHLENLLIHTVNGLLLFTLLKKTTSKTYTSAAVALLFLIHPTAVESVAWGVERKTVLSTLFFFLSIFSYLRYAETPKLSRYYPVVIFMALGLMAKSMIITLPFILLLLDILPRGRWNIQSDGGAPTSVIIIPLIIEKIPLIALSIASIAVSLASHSSSSIIDTTPLLGRISHAIISSIEHLSRLFWSNGHAIFYPLPQNKTFTTLLVSAITMAILTFASLFYARRLPILTVGWFWFLISFAPVSGLIRAGKWPGMADRFLYIPAIGIMIAVCFTAAYFVDKKPPFKPIFLIIFISFTALFAGQTNQQVQKWHDSKTIFTESLRINPNDSYSHYLLGRTLHQETREYAEAEKHLLQATKLDPKESYYAAELGELYLNMGEAEKALPFLRSAATVLFTDADVQNSLASALLDSGKASEAVQFLDKALKLKPNHRNALFNLGIAYYKLGKYDKAREFFTKTVSIYPDHIDAKINLGMTLIDLKKYDDAIIETEAALKKSPNEINAIVNLGLAQERKGDYKSAINSYKRALAINPVFEEAVSGLRRLGIKQ